MITIETRPVRLAAEQWHEPGDCPELVVTARHGRLGNRWGVHSMDRGFQPVAAGDWIVLGEGGIQSPHVYTPTEFHHKFKIIEEGHSP